KPAWNPLSAASESDCRPASQSAHPSSRSVLGSFCLMSSPLILQPVKHPLQLTDGPRHASHRQLERKFLSLTEEELSAH
ncbi:hypothetical protein ABG768_013730, partial [Culter alburnus]